jgi:hypothetical protein
LLLVRGELVDGRGQEVVVDEVLVSAVGRAQSGAENPGGGARDAIAGAPEDLEGGIGEELVLAARGL